MVTSADIVNRATQFIAGYNNQAPVTGTPPLFDNSVMGLAAGQLYDAAVQTVARQFGWDFARCVATLALSTGTAPLGYAYEYVYPSSGIQIRQLVPATITDANDPRPQKWTVGNAIIGLTAATGSIFFAGNPSNLDTVTLNGSVWTFVTGAAGANEVHIAGTTAATIGGLRIALNASTDPLLTVATYSNSGGPGTATLTIDYDTAGTVGNAYTLAASVGVVSGAVLTGGTSGQRRVIWSNLQNADGLFNNAPTEDAWDSLFTETVVRLLASELALATAGKGDRSKNILEQALGFERLGEQRGDS